MNTERRERLAHIQARLDTQAARGAEVADNDPEHFRSWMARELSNVTAELRWLLDDHTKLQEELAAQTGGPYAG